MDLSSCDQELESIEGLATEEIYQLLVSINKLYILQSSELCLRSLLEELYYLLKYDAGCVVKIAKSTLSQPIAFCGAALSDQGWTLVNQWLSENFEKLRRSSENWLHNIDVMPGALMLPLLHSTEDRVSPLAILLMWQEGWPDRGEQLLRDRL